MKLDVGTQSFHAKHVYNLQPNFIQCPNVKKFSVKVSLFLCDVGVLDLGRKSS